MTKPLPKILVTGIPECGIGLLEQLVSSIPFLRKGTWVNQWDADIYGSLEKTEPGEIRSGHLFYTADLKQYLDSHGFRTFFIYRDPRDMVVSYMMLVTEVDKTHMHHNYFARHLQDNDERLMKLITGFTESKEVAARYGANEIGYGNIVHHFMPYLGWLEDPGTCSVRYEHLVHDERTRRNEITKIADFLWNDMEHAGISKETLAAAMEKNILPKTSPPFRRGVSDGWRNHFTARHKSAFKELAGDLLIYLGYEQDENW